MIKNYDPSRVSVSWGGINITGFAEGTFIEAERDEDAFTKYVGSQGEVCRTRNLNRSGKVTITLMATSPINDLIDMYATTDDLVGLGGVWPLSINDFYGLLRVFATEAWVMKKPKVERAKEAGTVVWVFDCATIAIEPRGNTI